MARSTDIVIAVIVEKKNDSKMYTIISFEVKLMLDFDIFSKSVFVCVFRPKNIIEKIRIAIIKIIMRVNINISLKNNEKRLGANDPLVM
jgi:hypothetical protein